jgi:hypothetical protein
MKLLLQLNAFIPDIPFQEVVRYLGYRGVEPDKTLTADIEECKKQLTAVVSPHFVCAEFTLVRLETGLMLEQSGVLLVGQSINNHLAQSKRCLVMAATLGNEVDKLIRYMQVSEPHRALILDACANAMIENYCDKITVAAEVQACSTSETLTWRFSPGYGDFPLDIHTKLLPLLNTGRRMGLYETTTHLLTPLKSVTAFMGIISKDIEKGKRGCEACANVETCNFKQGGTTCGA